MARHGENIKKATIRRWEGRYPKAKKNGKQGNNTKDYELFRESGENWLKATRYNLKESSVSRYKIVLERHLFPEFGNTVTTKITRSDICTFTGRLLASTDDGGKALSPKTVSSILSVMKNVMDYVRLVKGWSVISFDGLMVKVPIKQLRVFSIHEQEILNSYLLANRTLSNLGILICLYTGIRIGELCALTWEDISIAEQTLNIRQTMQRIQKSDASGHKTQIVITPPKSEHSVRTIPIPNDLYRILIERKQPDGCFFLTGKNTSYIEPRTMENRFNKVMTECGIRGATVHTCRHTFATRAVELGFDIKTLSEILGHANVTITMNRYVHPSMEHKQENMNRLGILLDGHAAKV